MKSQRVNRQQGTCRVQAGPWRTCPPTYTLPPGRPWRPTHPRDPWGPTCMRTKMTGGKPGHSRLPCESEASKSVGVAASAGRERGREREARGARVWLGRVPWFGERVSAWQIAASPDSIAVDRLNWQSCARCCCCFDCLCCAQTSTNRLPSACSQVYRPAHLQ